MQEDKALQNFWLVDNRGLITSDRGAALQPGQKSYARAPTADLGEGLSLLQVVERVKPTILLGLSGVGGTFTEPVLNAMAKNLPEPNMPIVFRSD
jgi:malic enzyme